MISKNFEYKLELTSLVLFCLDPMNLNSIRSLDLKEQQEINFKSTKFLDLDLNLKDLQIKTSLSLKLNFLKKALGRYYLTLIKKKNQEKNFEYIIIKNYLSNFESLDQVYLTFLIKKVYFEKSTFFRCEKKPYVNLRIKHLIFGLETLEDFLNV